MAAHVSAARLCLLAGRRNVHSLQATCCLRDTHTVAARRWYISRSTGNTAGIQFRLDERTAHSSLDLFKKDTGIIYRMLGLDPSHAQDNPERFSNWAVVLGSERITGGRHYWEVTVKRSREFRVGVAEAGMPRDDCVGTSTASWVFAYGQRKWTAVTGGKAVPVPLVGKPDRVGLLLDYEAGVLALVDTERRAIVHRLRGRFRGPLCPAFGLWDGELLTHSGLEEPESLV